MTGRLISGMVGGGPGAMIGAAHRHAMWLDNQYVLAAGIFGRDPASSAAFAQSLAVERVYDDHRDMAEQEAHRDHSDDAVAVVGENPLTDDSGTAARLVAVAPARGAVRA